MEGLISDDIPCFLNYFPFLFNALRWGFIPWYLCNRTCGHNLASVGSFSSVSGKWNKEEPVFIKLFLMSLRGKAGWLG